MAYLICDTETLIRLNKEAVDNPHCNRALSDNVYDVLDPKGAHILDSGHLVSRYANSGFKRYYLYLKLVDRDKPVEGNTIDLTPEQTEGLLVYTKAHDEVLKNGKECVQCGHIMPHLLDDYICLQCRRDDDNEETIQEVLERL